MLQQLNATFGPKGLVLVGPTQLYGIAAMGEEATPSVEMPWIESGRVKYYGRVGQMYAPVSAQNFATYGASSLPTYVLIDKAGIVRYYHPGRVTYEELAAHVAKLM